MTKRIIGSAIAAVLVLGVAGIAFASATPGSEQPPAYALDKALAEAAEPDPPKPGAGGRKQELQACVKPKLDAGADKREAMRECAAQLGLPAPGAGRPGKGGKQDRRPAPGRAAHAELVVPKKGVEGQWETVVVDRGKVTAASADSISLQRPDGPTVTIRVAASTKVRGAASAADLAAGREVVVVSAGGEARSVVARR